MSINGLYVEEFILILCIFFGTVYSEHNNFKVWHGRCVSKILNTIII